MAKKGIPKTTVNRIRTKVKQGKSANQIQRELKREGRGIRRQTLLALVRRYKGVKPKPQRYKYIPRKYRTRPAIAKPKRPKRIAPPPTPKPPIRKKHISIYGKEGRYNLSGTGRNLYRFMIDAVEHPPKKRFVTVDVDKVRGLSQRAKYVDYGEEWSERPEIKS